MSASTNKRVVLGVTGGIAAYKSPDVVRRLRERGFEVRVVMTRAACEFVTPLTLQAVSGNPVHTAFLDENAEAAMGHIELARWANSVLIAPATADCLAKLAHGIAGPAHGGARNEPADVGSPRDPGQCGVAGRARRGVSRARRRLAGLR
jgi:phosphopantothenoylcysteine decarboxylase/phosphopantothenate--cysteine ligase